MPADDAADRWAAVFAQRAPARRPLCVLDVGSGTGRLTVALARTFGGPVYGLEPAAGLRRRAERDAAHPAVRYLAGLAEAIPLPDDHIDLAVLFLSLHHLADRGAALAELARVGRGGLVVFVRCAFADRMPIARWMRHFPTVTAMASSSCARLEDVVAHACAAGFDATVETVTAEPPQRLRDQYDRARSLLARSGPIPSSELAAGLAAMARDEDRHGDDLIPLPAADLLSLRRRPR